MKNIKKSVLILLFLIPINYCYSDNKIAAVVGTDIITMLEVKERMALVVDSIINNTNEKPDEKQLLPRVVQALIDERLYAQEAAKNKITISEEELEETFNHIEATNGLKAGSLREHLRSKKLSFDALYSQTKAQLLWKKVITYKVRPKLNVTEKEIEEALVSVVPEDANVTFKQIVLPFKEIGGQPEIDNKIMELTELRSKIKSCDNFDSLASNYKIIPEKYTLPINSLHPELRDMISNLPVGMATKVIKSTVALHLIVVCERGFAGVNNKESKDDVREMLMQKKITLQANHYLHELRKKTYIEVRI